MRPRAPGAPGALILAALALHLAACGGGGGSGGNGGGGGGGGGGPPPVVDLYVDAVNGSNANPGTQALPLRSITAAFAVAQAGATVFAAPGTYTAGIGETFPMHVPAGVALEGDVANRGNGATPTVILGHGPISVTWEAGLVPHAGSVVRGFVLDMGDSNDFAFGVYTTDDTAEVHDCTFPATCYGGVLMDGTGATDVHHCTFVASSYGVWISTATGAFKVRDSTFGPSAFPIRGDSGSAGQISSNAFTTANYMAIQDVGFSGLIQGNTFTAATYADAAIRIENSSTPTLRGNTFTCDKAVLVTLGLPDLGTAAQAGGNSFSAVTGFAVKHDAAGQVQAQGNLWQHAPPVAGDIIVTTLGASVKYGPNPADQVP